MKRFAVGILAGVIIGVSVGIGCNCCIDEKTACKISRKTKKLIKSLARNLDF